MGTYSNRRSMLSKMIRLRGDLYASSKICTPTPHKHTNTHTTRRGRRQNRRMTGQRPCDAHAASVRRVTLLIAAHFAFSLKPTYISGEMTLVYGKSESSASLPARAVFP